MCPKEMNVNMNKTALGFELETTPECLYFSAS